MTQIGLRRSSSLLLLFATIFVCVPATAGTVAYSFTGNVDLVFGGPFYGISPVVGDPVSGFLIYDTSVPGTIVDGNVQQFLQPSPNRFGFTLRGLTIETDAGYVATVQTNSYYSLQLYDNDGTLKVNGVSQPADLLQLALDSQSNAGFQLVGLPTTLNLANFSFTFGEIATATPLFSGARFQLTSLTPIPEPATWSFLGLRIIIGVFSGHRGKC